MNISKNKIYIWIKENKWIILCFLLFFFLMCYTASNIIIINDDLPYSMYMRGSNRVSNVVQIIKI